MTLQIGSSAPSVKYTNSQGEETDISNSGQETWVIFIPFAFTGVCTGEVCDIRDNPTNYEKDGRETIIVSCDPAPSQKAWGEELGFKGTMISDFYPHGKISKEFDNFNDELGCSNRVSFLVNEEGKIAKVVAADSLGTSRDLSQYA